MLRFRSILSPVWVIAPHANLKKVVDICRFIGSRVDWSIVSRYVAAHDFPYLELFPLVERRTIHPRARLVKRNLLTCEKKRDKLILENREMKIGIVILLAAALFSPGCALTVPAGWEYPGFSHPERFTSSSEAVAWVANNIAYANSDLWQTPDKTYQLRTGDCVDYCLLTMYFLHEMAIDTELMEIRTAGGYHALVHDLTEGIIYDPQSRGVVTITDQSIIDKTRSYQEAMWMASTVK